MQFQRLRSHLVPILITLTMLLSLALPALSRAEEAQQHLQTATAWLISQQDATGGYAGYSGELDPTTTASAVIALAAARDAGIEVDLKMPLAYLTDQALVLTQMGPGDAATFVLALVAARQNPSDFASVNPLAIVQTVAGNDTELFSATVYDRALISLALTAAGADVPQSLVDSLRISQNTDGSWAYDGTVAEGSGDTNTTALVIQAMVAAGLKEDPTVANAMAYLSSAQMEDGSVVYQVAEGSIADANSTAMAVQAVIAVGEDPASDQWKNMLGALLSFQNENGSFPFQKEQPDDNVFTTIQVIPALAARALPLTPATPVANG